jgi:GMP synthase-like glutamine amidotransferase
MVRMAASRVSRRRFLSRGLLVGAGLALASCAPAPATPLAVTPSPLIQMVEVTRVVEKVVEVTKIVSEPSVVPSATPTQENSMIWYVDIEHEKALADPKRRPDFDRVRNQRAQICGEAAGVPCEPILYQQVSWELAKQKNITGFAISGNTTDWIEYDFKTFQPLFDLVKSGKFAVIGFCGGHQLIGLMYDAPCDAIRKLNPGEADKGDFAPGWFKEVGFMPAHVVQDDPVFKDLGRDPVFFESHYWEIKEVPQGFDLLASTDNVKVTAIKHRQYPIYGTQFHPEVNSAEQRDGLSLLKNFFRMTGIRKG